MAKWTGLERRITAEEAEAERDQLFDRPPRRPSPATLAMLRKVSAPPVDTERVKAGRRPAQVG